MYVAFMAMVKVDLILAALLSQGQVVPGALQLPGVTRDPKDDPLVACAVEGGTDYLVSGDRDLLDLGETENIRMVVRRPSANVFPRPGAFHKTDLCFYVALYVAQAQSATGPLLIAAQNTTQACISFYRNYRIHRISAKFPSCTSCASCKIRSTSIFPPPSCLLPLYPPPSLADQCEFRLPWP